MAELWPSEVPLSRTCLHSLSHSLSSSFPGPLFHYDNETKRNGHSRTHANKGAVGSFEKRKKEKRGKKEKRDKMGEKEGERRIGGSVLKKRKRVEARNFFSQARLKVINAQLGI